MTKSTKKRYALRSFASFIARYKLRFAVVFFSFVLANIALAVIPVFIGKLIGTLTTNPIDRHVVIVDVIILIICSTGHNLLWRGSELLYMKLLLPLSFEYETMVFSQIIRKPYPYFVDKFTGKISAYIATLGDELRNFITDILYNYANEIVRLVAVSIILLSVNWYTGAIFMGALVLMFFVGRVTIRNSTKYEQAFADIKSDKTGKIIDAVANFVNVKSFHKSEPEIKEIVAEQHKTAQAAKKSFVWSVYFWGSMSFFVRDLIWPITIILNVYLFMHQQISLAQLITFLSSVLLFSDYIWGMIWNASQFNLKEARIQEAHEYLFGDVNITKEYFETQFNLPTMPNFKNQLTINELNFAYPDKKDSPVLTNISLNIKKGEKIGIVGKSGGGKTTLTKLLLGYYPVEKGQLELDGTEIESANLAQIIAYVPQDTTLFHRTVAENIAYATNKSVTREEIIHAAKQAHADEFVSQIDKGYDALVGERGVKLSAGQRQRIAIARAFLDDKPILILDEATSALDSESEVLVQEALEALWQNKTVVAIAHRLSTLRNMDRVLVIDKGQIAENGTHQELLAKKGLYAKLWAHQSGGFLED